MFVFLVIERWLPTTGVLASMRVCKSRVFRFLERREEEYLTPWG
jgi:hypothetical protein